MEETKKIGFFKRIKFSIFNLENYKIFAEEKFSKALKYFLLLVVIATLILSIASTVQLVNEVSKLINYIESDFPEFSLTDGTLEVEGNVNAYDSEYDARLIVDTSEEVSDEALASYKDEASQSLYSVIFLKDKAIYRVNEMDEDYEITYNNIASTLGISNITKAELIENYFNSNTKIQMYAIIWVYAFITVFMMNILTIIEDILIVTIFGWIATKITKVALKFSQVASLAIYSLTLSIILSTIYSVIYSLCDFEIKYFSVLYMIIAYIYMVASIMIMKENTDRSAPEAVTAEGQIVKTDSDENNDSEQNDEKKKEPKDKESVPKDENKEKLPEPKAEKNKNSSENNNINNDSENNSNSIDNKTKETDKDLNKKD